MSMIETVRDVKNNLLSRREITCKIKGLGGKLKKLEAIDIISKQFKLDGKVIVPIMLKNETGRPMISATFYVYDDEKLARAHIKPALFKRLERAKGGGQKTEAKETPAEKKEAKQTAAEKKQAKAPEEEKEKPAKKALEPPKEKSK